MLNETPKFRVTTKSKRSQKSYFLFAFLFETVRVREPSFPRLSSARARAPRSMFVCVRRAWEVV